MSGSSLEFGKKTCPHCFVLNLLMMIKDMREDLSMNHVAGSAMQAVAEFVVLLSNVPPQSQIEPCCNALRMYFRDALQGVSVGQHTEFELPPGMFYIPGPTTKQ